MSTKTIQDWLDAVTKSVADAENALIEADLKELMVGYEVVYQQAPEGGGVVYRGVTFRDVLIIDHHPDWPFITADKENPA